MLLLPMAAGAAAAAGWWAAAENKCRAPPPFQRCWFPAGVPAFVVEVQVEAVHHRPAERRREAVGFHDERERPQGAGAELVRGLRAEQLPGCFVREVPLQVAVLAAQLIDDTPVDHRGLQVPELAQRGDVRVDRAHGARAVVVVLVRR